MFVDHFVIATISCGSLVFYMVLSICGVDKQGFVFSFALQLCGGVVFVAPPRGRMFYALRKTRSPMRRRYSFFENPTSPTDTNKDLTVFSL